MPLILVQHITKNAWETGAHIRIAEMLAADNPELARKHVNEAQKIIHEDPRQILRKAQLERLQRILPTIALP